MTENNLHPWNVKPQEAARIQSELRERLVLAWDNRDVSLVGGVDIGLTAESARAAIVVLSFPDLAPVESVTADVPLVFPYIPGLLAFREGPAFLAAWDKLREKPGLLMFDGQGIAHPRGIGIAAQMGLWVDLPTLGVAKSRLYGRHKEPGPYRGDTASLFDENDPQQLIGVVLRSKENTRPLYISPGHRVDVPAALELVLRCLAGYRLPEPTRLAHKVAGGEQLAS
jgi:deoxyribonuclease V